MAYTYLDQVLTDYLGYMKVSKNFEFNLGDVSSIAIERWPWFVKNWELSIYPKLKKLLPKTDFYNDLLKDMNNEVITQKLFSSTSTNPFLNLIKFIKYKPLLNNISLTEINITPSESVVLREEQKRLKNLSVTDFKDMIFFLRNSAASAIQTVGLGDADGVLVQNFSLVDKQRTYSIQELDQVGDIFDLADEIDGIIYDLQQRTEQEPNLLAVANRNTDADSRVVFEQAYSSAVAVPFVHSLEYMSEQHFGTKDRWFELAALNKLQPPYVDKTGTKEYLLGPGTLASVKISSVASSFLKIGSKVKIGSYSVKEESRFVIKIIKFDDSTMIVSLSGKPDLSKLKISEKPYLKIYRPQTVNEDSLVLLPVDGFSTLITSGKKPTLDVLRRLDKSLLDFGVDIRRDEKSGELQVGKNGDFELVYGISAVRQALNTLLFTNIKELPFHPNYGIPFANEIGSRFYGNIEIASAFSEILQNVIIADGRYSSVYVQNLTVNENSISVSLVVSIDGSNVIIPLSFISS